MEDSQLRQLSLEGGFILLFPCDIQQDTLPVEWISLLVANKIGIFLDPDGCAIPSDQTILFQETGTGLL